MNCRKDPWYFLTHWVKTVDVHDKEKPVKPFPDEEYLWTLTQYWIEYPRLLIPKSRQMTVTWLCCALYLWDAMFIPHRLTFFQSKKEEDADENLKRSLSIWKNLPKFMRDWCPIRDVFCKLTFTRNGSVIRGVPSGADHARQYTSSGYFSDEMVYQNDVDKVLASVGPTLTGGGRFTGVSSAGPSYFAQMVFDEV